MKLGELKERLEADKFTKDALVAVANQRKKDTKSALLKLSRDIDVKELTRGMGSESQKQELYKFLAFANIKSDDLQREEIMSIIQDTLANFIADDEMDEDELAFTAQALAFTANEQRRVTREKSMQKPIPKRTNLPPSTI